MRLMSSVITGLFSLGFSFALMTAAPKKADAFWGCNIAKTNLGQENNCKDDCDVCEAEQNGTDDCACKSELHGTPGEGWITWACVTAGSGCKNNW